MPAGAAPRIRLRPLLARRPDFQLGSAIVRPSMRTVEGPGGSVTTEPRVMQVLLAFADAGGAVLTRDDLLRTCWKGMFVGDDSINRAIAEVRRIARETGAGFGIETIPRIGYRLTGGAAASTRPLAEPEPVPAPVAATPEPSTHSGEGNASLDYRWRTCGNGRGRFRGVDGIPTAARPALSRTAGSRQAGAAHGPAR